MSCKRERLWFCISYISIYIRSEFYYKISTQCFVEWNVKYILRTNQKKIKFKLLIDHKDCYNICKVTLSYILKIKEGSYIKIIVKVYF